MLHFWNRDCSATRVKSAGVRLVRLPRASSAAVVVAVRPRVVDVSRNSRRAWTGFMKSKRTLNAVLLVGLGLRAGKDEGPRQHRPEAEQPLSDQFRVGRAGGSDPGWIDRLSGKGGGFRFGHGWPLRVRVRLIASHPHLKYSPRLPRHRRTCLDATLGRATDTAYPGW